MNDKETVKSRKNLMVADTINPSGNHLVPAMNSFKANGEKPENNNLHQTRMCVTPKISRANLSKFDGKSMLASYRSPKDEKSKNMISLKESAPETNNQTTTNDGNQNEKKSELFTS